jgi:FkbM family methyltransferase
LPLSLSRGRGSSRGPWSKSAKKQIGKEETKVSNSMLYNRINWGLRRILKFPQYIEKVGLLTGSLLFMYFTFIRKDVKISYPGIKFPIVIRGKTTDIYIFENIFICEYYNVSQNIQPNLIIDVGAYTGFSALFFANKFPGAKIIAIEPEVSNFKILRENTLYYQNIELVQSAIWHKKTWLRIKDVGEGEWGFMVEEAVLKDQDCFMGITIDEILKGSGYDKIDILKINIEGSEKDLFSDNYEKWLPMVKVLIIELHDFLKAGCSTALYKAIKNYNFTQILRGSYIILINNDNYD